MDQKISGLNINKKEKMSKDSDKESPKRTSIFTEGIYSYNSRKSARRNNSLKKDKSNFVFDQPKLIPKQTNYPFLNINDQFRSRSQDRMVYQMTGIQNESGRDSSNSKGIPQKTTYSIAQHLSHLAKNLPDPFLSDGIYLEVLYYQLTSLGLPRTAICSTPPIITIILQIKHLSEGIGNIVNILIDMCKYDQVVNNWLAIIKEHKPLLEALTTSLSMSYGRQQIDKLPLEDYLMQCLLQLSKNKYFQYELLINDLIKYQELYLDQKETILDSYGDHLLRNNNICIGFIKFLFTNEEDEDYSFRFPIGEFQKNSFVDISKLDPDIPSDESHSESVMSQWLIYDFLKTKSILKKLWKTLLHFTGILYLKEIQIQVTSENRVCPVCCDMFIKFPIQDLLDPILMYFEDGKIELKIETGFKFTTLSQYFLNRGYKVGDTPPNRGNFQNYKVLHSNRTISVPILYFEMGTTGIVSSQKFFHNRYSTKSSEDIDKEIDSILIPCTIFVSSADQNLTENQKQLRTPQSSDKKKKRSDQKQKDKTSSKSDAFKNSEQDSEQFLHQYCEEIPQFHQSQELCEKGSLNIVLEFDSKQGSPSKQQYNIKSLNTHRQNGITRSLDSYSSELLKIFKEIQQQPTKNVKEIEDNCNLDSIVINQAFKHLTMLLHIGKQKNQSFQPSDINFEWIQTMLKSMIFQGNYNLKCEFLDYIISNSSVIPNLYSNLDDYEQRYSTISNSSIFSKKIGNLRLLFRDYKELQQQLKQFTGVAQINLSKLRNYTMITLIAIGDNLENDRQQKLFPYQLLPEENEPELDCKKLINLLSNYALKLVINKNEYVNNLSVLIFTIKKLGKCCIEKLQEFSQNLFLELNIRLNFQYRYLKLEKYYLPTENSKWFTFFEPSVMWNRYQNCSYIQNQQSLKDMSYSKNSNFIYDCLEHSMEDVQIEQCQNSTMY